MLHPIITKNVQNGVALHEHKLRNLVSISQTPHPTTVCCTPDEITLRHCSSCSFRLKKSLEMVLFYPLVAISLISLSSEIFKLIQIF